MVLEIHFMNEDDNVKRLFLVILMIMFLMSTPASATSQSSDECDPAAVKQWLINRQSWINATQDVLDAPGMSIPAAQIYLYDHLQALEDIPRPGCTTDVMLMTYFFYNQLQHLLVCAQQGNDDCVKNVQSRVALYRANIDATIAPLATLSGFNANEYVNLQPDGWSLTQPSPVVAQPSSTPGNPPTAVPTLTQQFTGAGPGVTDIVTLQNGDYFLTLTTGSRDINIRLTGVDNACEDVTVYDYQMEKDIPVNWHFRVRSANCRYVFRVTADSYWSFSVSRMTDEFIQSHTSDLPDTSVYGENTSLAGIYQIPAGFYSIIATNLDGDSIRVVFEPLLGNCSRFDQRQDKLGASTVTMNKTLSVASDCLSMARVYVDHDKWMLDIRRLE